MTIRLWRVGRRNGRVIYAMLNGDEPSDDDVMIGTFDSAALAADAVTAHNNELRDRCRSKQEIACTCNQHGDYCPIHPSCACGCQRHAHRGGRECIAGKISCHGCDGYRPAQLRRFEELWDDDLEHATGSDLIRAYRELRAHHIEETTALWEKITSSSGRTA